jgi:hypothetical protein
LHGCLFYGGDSAAVIFTTGTVASITNCVFSGCGRALKVADAGFALSTHHNIFYNNTYDYFTGNADKDFITQDHNCHFGAMSGISDNTAFTSRVTGEGINVFTNPQFRDAINHDFRLLSGSPCIDTGANLGSSFDDVLDCNSKWPDELTTQNQNTFGTGWEIGAYVYDEICDEGTIDSDGDGVFDSEDNCFLKPNGQNLGTCSATSDKPGINCNSDADCVIGCSTNGKCSFNQEDTDGDGIGDVCDNCPNICNSFENDADGDGIGDVCYTTPGCGGCGLPQCEQQC